MSMNRRSFTKNALSASAALMAASLPLDSRAGTITSFNVLGNLRKLQLFPTLTSAGTANNPYVGCYLHKSGQDGYLNWYFNNIAVNAFIDLLTRTEVEMYISSYLYNTTSNNSLPGFEYRIADITFPNKTSNLNNPGDPAFNNVPGEGIRYSDSNDSYAATFFSVLASYHRRYGSDPNASNFISTKLIGNIQTIKNIAKYNIIDLFNVNSTNLTVGFRSDSWTTSTQTPFKTRSLLMDNCEVYRGLKDLAYLIGKLTPLDTASVNNYNLIADKIAIGIYSLYKVDPNDNSSNNTKFMPSDVDKGYNDQLTFAGEYFSNAFYPGRAAQVFPQAFDVPDPAGQTTAKYITAWKVFFKSSAWVYLTDDPSGYPWMIFSYVASKIALSIQPYDERVNAQSQMTSFINSYNSNISKMTLISDLAYFKKARDLWPSYWV